MLRQLMWLFSIGLVAAGVGFVICLVAVGLLFTRDKLGLFLVGLGRVILSFLHSPFVYIRKAMLALASYGKRGESIYERGDQYLSSKLLLALQSALVVLSLLILGSGLVGAFLSFIPTRDSWNGMKEARRHIQELQTEKAPLEEELKKLDQEWESTRETATTQYRSAKEKTRSDAGRVRNQVEAAYAGQMSYASSMLSSLNNYAGSVSENASPDNLASMRRRMHSMVSNSYYGSSEDERQLSAWTDAWYEEQLASRDLQAMSPDAIRAEFQPKYKDLAEQIPILEARIGNAKGTLDMYKHQARPRWRLVGLFLGMGILAFLLVVWILGVAIEALWAGIMLALDVKELREASVPRSRDEEQAA